MPGGTVVQIESRAAVGVERSHERAGRDVGRGPRLQDFDIQPEVQRFFEAHQPDELHNLDGNGDGEASESLPPGN